MDEASRQYLEAMESLFSHPGWKLLMDDVKGWQEAISSQWQSITPETLRFQQGRYDGLRQIATHEKTLETLKASMIEQAALAASIEIENV